MDDPNNCNTMKELRCAIDALDRDLAHLLARRAAFIDRAAQLKPAEGLPARIHDRVEEVAQNARANAEREGLDPEFAETLWRMMIEWSIAREECVLGPSPSETGKDKR